MSTSLHLNLPEVRRQLKKSVHDCSQRGLYNSAKWSAELLVSIKNDKSDHTETTSFGDDDDVYLLAKTYFDVKEYYRVAHTLRSATERTPKSLFLRNYSLFLAGEKRKAEERAEVGERCPVENKELSVIKETLEPLYYSKKLDGFCLYLYGIVLRELSCMSMARSVFVESVQAYPCNWSCWQDLVPLCPDRDVLRQLSLPQDVWMFQFFLAYLNLELQNNAESLRLYQILQGFLPNNNYILAQTALVRYNMQEFDKAEKLFEELLKVDPCRLTNMDTYSNILYVTEANAKLSYLAYKASIIDKYTPETCSIIGNYYSLKADHSKAVVYFQRALNLNPQYLSAWTLMGHEYVEMKNTNAAISAYRKAVDINPRDYRAWYGLGQTYELLAMPLYALYYFGKACQLRPYDARMWCAMAECYEKVGNIPSAIKCYKRADCNKDREGLALNKLAQLLKGQGKMDETAFYYKKNLDRRKKEGLPSDQDTINALLFLAQHTKDKGLLKEAEGYCNQLLDYTGKEKEEAKALLREIHSTKNYRDTPPTPKQ